MADLMTVAWKVYGIKLMTKSFFATSASRALSSVTSREIGWAFLTPSESFFALSMVLHARKKSALSFEEELECLCTNRNLNACFTENIQGWACYEARTEH